MVHRNATVAGSLLGAYLTNTSLPAHWVEHLALSAWLSQKTRCALALIDPEGGHPAYDHTQDPDVLIDGGKGPYDPKELDKRYLELLCEVGKRVNDGMVLPADFKTKKDKEGCIVC